MPNLPFDPSQFVPVTIMAKLPYILVVHPKVPVATFAEFIAYAKANPGKLNYGTPGLGSSSHLTGEMLKLASRHPDDARALRAGSRRRSPICSPATPT